MSTDINFESTAKSRLHGLDKALKATLLILIGLLAGFGLSRQTAPTGSSGVAVTGAGPQVIEDWHGNVMRSGSSR